jgi:hypothetical protein
VREETNGDGGMVAALPLAAGLVLELVRWLPIGFEYRENELGVVSRATLERYPLQKETFWLLFAALSGALLAWALARLLGPASRRPATQASVEALGALGLVLALWLPGAAGGIGLLASAALALGIAWRTRGSGREPGPAAIPGPETRPRSALRAAAFLAAIGLLALLLTPPVWTSLWSVLAALPDERFATDTFVFHAEWGQHLAWADALLRGELHGRDFFCLYGPLYDLGLAGLWQLTGRSVAAWRLYQAGGNALGYAIALLLCALLVRRRVFILLLSFCVVWIPLRIALGLAGLGCLVAWRRSGGAGWVLAAGVVAGTSLLYSQEFGLALLVTSALALLSVGEGRAAGRLLAGVVAVVAPVLGWFAWQGALGPMLRDLIAYPGYMLAGYGKLPFPSLLEWLPLRLASLEKAEWRVVGLGYAAPAVYGAALLLALRVGALDPRYPLAWVREALGSLARDPQRFGVVATAVYGALCFRSAMGRSDIVHVMTAVAPAAVLVVVAFDRLAADWSLHPARRSLAATRGAALLIFALHTGMQTTSVPWTLLSNTLSDLGRIQSGAYAPAGSPQVVAVAEWIRERTEEAEPVLFLPNNAGYYYLARRPSPIRFVLGHQMVTDAHRQEALEALVARPPRYVVWDDGVLQVDRIGHREVFGPKLLAWIGRHYVEVARFEQTRILRRRDLPRQGP